MTRNDGLSELLPHLEPGARAALMNVFEEASQTVSDDVLDVENAIMEVLLGVPERQRIAVMVRVMSVLISIRGH